MFHIFFFILMFHINENVLAVLKWTSFIPTIYYLILLFNCIHQTLQTLWDPIQATIIHQVHTALNNHHCQYK